LNILTVHKNQKETKNQQTSRAMMLAKVTAFKPMLHTVHFFMFVGGAGETMNTLHWM
jgi:hypothetical protein